MYLLINTALADKIVVALIDSSKRGDFLLAKISLKARLQQSEKLLPTIDRLLKKNKAGLDKLKGIMVVSGPGSFTSLRIGVAAANTLAYSLKIPVVDIKLSELKDEIDLEEITKKGSNKLKKQKKFKIVLPHYGRKPNITKPKK